MIGSDLSYHCWYYHLHGCCCCCCCDNRRCWLVVDLSFHGCCCCCCESLSCCGFDATPYSHYFCRWIQQATMCICLCWAMVYQRYNIYNIYWSLCPNPVRTHTRRYIEHRQWRCRSESGNFGTLSRIKHFHTDREFSSKPRTRVGCGNPGVGPSTEPHGTKPTWLCCCTRERYQRGKNRECYLVPYSHYIYI